MSTALADPTYMNDLGNGLICRWSTKADQEKIGYLMGMVYRGSAEEPFNRRAGDEPRLFMSDGFPWMTAGDIAIVEDTHRAERPVVACVCYWRHRWSYGGIEFGVGRPENVATDPAYRNRGLVRALHDMVHARSAANGDQVQAITGIAYFYRQFGYEYALDFGGQHRIHSAAIPAKQGDTPEAYTLQLARVDDIPTIMALYNQRRSRSLVWHEAPAAYWRYHITSWEDPVVQQRGATDVGLFGRLYLIVDQRGEHCGYTWLAARRWEQAIRVYALELAAGVNWQRALPSLLRAIQTHGEVLPIIPPDPGPLTEISLFLGKDHPVYALLSEPLLARTVAPYAWYLRVPDIPAFLQQITPVLEKRLADSVLVGQTGTLKFDLYRLRFALHLHSGKVAAIEPWQPPAYGDEAQFSCPPLVFLQLLFGYRSLAELQASFPDVWGDEATIPLLNILFPKEASTVYSLSYT
ncbi:MAG: GNAT family N-acetyltransferase [Caldilineaceae bacterium]|nr:GNAT family N-acetyltransferase [Caldilineaceae bacterium]